MESELTYRCDGERVCCVREGEELWSLALADVRVVIEYVSPSLGVGVDHCFALVDGEMNEYHLLVDDFLCEQVIPVLQSVLGCDLSYDFYDGASGVPEPDSLSG